MEPFDAEFDDVLEAARALLSEADEADLIDASELVNRALYLRPDDADAWMLKAQLLSALEDDHAALAAIEMAVARAPFAAETHYWRAAILADLERPKDALRAIDRAFRYLEPEDEWLVEDLFFEKAGALEMLGRASDAISTYEEGLRTVPTSDLLATGLEPLRRRNLRASLVVLEGGRTSIRPTR